MLTLARWCLNAAFVMAAVGFGAALNGFTDKGMVWVGVAVFLLLASVVVRVPWPDQSQPVPPPQRHDDA